MNNNIVGAIYIMKNTSFPDYIKIGYADDVYDILHCVAKINEPQDNLE